MKYSKITLVVTACILMHVFGVTAKLNRVSRTQDTNQLTEYSFK
jgi:hypothetical protein